MQSSKKSKWLIYTVLVGLLPFLMRILIFLVIDKNHNNIDMISANDFIAFGLVLHICNINEIEHIYLSEEKQWKTIQNGMSIVFIAFYSILYTLTLISDNFQNVIDLQSLTICVFVLSVFSFCLSYSIYDRLSALESQGLIK
jgi:hypothetical protein